MAESLTTTKNNNTGSILHKRSRTNVDGQQFTHGNENGSHPMGIRFKLDDEEIPTGGLENAAENPTTKMTGEDKLTEKERNVIKASHGPISPGKRHSHIPVLSRPKPDSGTSDKPMPPFKIPSQIRTLRSPRKFVSLQTRTKSAIASNQSGTATSVRPNSKLTIRGLQSGRSKSSGYRSSASGLCKRTKKNEQCLFPKKSSARANSTESSLNYTKSYTTITLSSPRAEESDTPTDNSTQTNSPAIGSPRPVEKPESEGATELAPVTKSPTCDSFDLEQCLNGTFSSKFDFSNLQMDLLDLKDSESELFSTVPGSSMSSARQTLSTGSKTSPKPDIVKTPQTTIRTPSGDELIVSSSMEFYDLEADMLLSDNADTISLLLKQTEDLSFIKELCEKEDEQKPEEVREVENSPKEETIVEEDDQEEPEFDQGTIEVAETEVDRKGPEEDLMADVNYRQFVYHPTVLRRQLEEELELDRRPSSKSIEDNFSCRLGDNERDKCEVSKKSSFMRNSSQMFASDRDVNIPPLRAWTPEIEERQLVYSNLQIIQNSDYVLKEMKKERSQRERLAVAVLRLTAKCIQILAVLDLWPGDNCQLLTSYLLRR